MSVSTASGAVDLASPDTFLDGVPHEALAELRRTDPVHWQPMLGEPGFWAVLRHADVAVWGGRSRLAYHGVAPLAEGEHPALGRRRVNLTFRRAL